MGNRSDNFTDTDGTNLTAHTPTDGGGQWVALSGTWTINSNAVAGDGTTAQANAVLESSLADVDVQVTVSGTIVDSGLVFRVTDNSNYYLVTFQPGTTELKLYKQVASSFTQLAIETATTVTAGDVMKVRANGTALSVYRNGSIISALSITDSTYTTQTKHGIRSNSDATVFDTFSITAVSSVVDTPFTPSIGATSLSGNAGSSVQGFIYTPATP